MASTAKLSAMLTADPSGFVRGMARAGQALAQFQKQWRVGLRVGGVFAMDMLANRATDAIKGMRALANEIASGKKNFADFAQTVLNNAPSIIGSFSRLGTAIGNWIVDQFTDAGKQFDSVMRGENVLGALLRQKQFLERNLALAKATSAEDRKRAQILQWQARELFKVNSLMEKLRDEMEESVRLRGRGIFGEITDLIRQITQLRLKALGTGGGPAGTDRRAGAFERSTVEAFRQAGTTNTTQNILQNIQQGQQRSNQTLQRILDWLKGTGANTIVAPPA